MEKLFEHIKNQQLNEVSSIVSLNPVMLWNWREIGNGAYATPLGYAIYVNAENIVKYFVDEYMVSGGYSAGQAFGVNIDSYCFEKDNNKNTLTRPLELARRLLFTNIENILLKFKASQ